MGIGKRRSLLRHERGFEGMNQHDNDGSVDVLTPEFD